jgi:hypothetical protein
MTLSPELIHCIHSKLQEHEIIAEVQKVKKTLIT